MALASDFAAKYGPWAIVAGASEGLGAAFAHEIAGAGLNVVLIARREKLLHDLARDLEAKHSVEVRTVVCDLGTRDSMRAVEEATEDIEVGLLVYNAAYSLIGLFLDTSIEDHLTEIDVNCRGPLMLSHHFGQRMVQRGGGGILLMSSMAGYQGSALIANYGATKAYNIVLAEGLWDELRGEGVDVLACCAGATRTPNYESSDPTQTGFLAPPLMEPVNVAREGLSALARGGGMIPGRLNRAAGFLLHRLIPRRSAVRIMGRNTRALYSR